LYWIEPPQRERQQLRDDDDNDDDDDDDDDDGKSSSSSSYRLYRILSRRFLDSVMLTPNMFNHHFYFSVEAALERMAHDDDDGE